MLCNYTLKAYIILDMYRGGILNIFKRFIPRLIIVLVMCIISAIGIFTEKNLTANKEISQNRKIVIIDAGHAALENTIKTPKNHRQANVGTNDKTRLYSGF